MEEAESQVIKYTNMTKQEVNELNEDFKKMDTRTAREQLNNLAGDAGKLGITGKKGIEDFVDAGDKINVALGDELGKDAVKNIGKLALMFGEDKKMGLRGAMLATGSAINQLSQASSSDAGYLVDFTARVAGASHQAKISQADIIGFASVLDENMQQVEMAGTAFQTLLLKMYQNPAKFAKMAGQDVKSFTRLLKTDANEALLQFIQSLKAQGGLDKLAPMFKDMGLDGVRASGVISTLAGKIADVRREQKIANDAYKDGTSVIQEFNIQNNTVQAGIDKAKKRFLDMSIDLGEKLLPVEMEVISVSSKGIKMITTTITFIGEHKRALISLIAIISAYIVAAKANYIWNTKLRDAHLLTATAEKLEAVWCDVLAAKHYLLAAATSVLHGNISKARREFQLFSAALGGNPWGIALAAFVAIGAAVYLYATRTKEATESQKAFQRIQNKSNEQYDEQASKIQQLNSIVHDNKISLDERRKALNELREIIPNYNAMLDDEGKITRDNTSAIKDYLVQLNKKIIYEASKDELLDLYKKRRVALKDYNDEVKSYRKSEKEYEEAQSTAGVPGEEVGLAGASANANGDRDKLIDTHKKILDIDSAIRDVNKDIEKSSKSVAKSSKKTVDNNGGGGGGYVPEGKKKKKKNESPYKIDSNDLEAEHQKELNMLKKNAIDNNRTEEEYNLAAINEDENYYKKKLALIKKYEAKTKDKKEKSELLKQESEINSKLIDITKKKGEDEIKLLQEQRDKKLERMDTDAEKAKQSLAHQYEDRKISEGEYNVEVAAIDENSLSARLDILQDYDKKINSIEIKDGQTRLKAVQESDKAVVKADEDACTARANTWQTMQDTLKDFKKNAGLESSAKEENDERLKEIKKFYEEAKAYMVAHQMDTKALDDAYNAANLQSGEEYQKKIIEIKESYGLDVSKEQYELELKALKNRYAQGELSTKEYHKALQILDEKYLEVKLAKWESKMQEIQDLASNVSSVMQNLADAETITSDAKYDKEIAAAKKAGKDTTKLEEEKEAAQNSIKKKYADIQFAAAILQIGASTAVGAMEAYKALAGIYLVGPALGAAAAAAVVVAGAAQIKVAKANRDAAKGLYSGGYSDEYIDGYTSTGNSHDVSGAIPVHNNEFVANHEAVANPHVRKFLDIFNVAQKNGSIRMLDTTAILGKLQLTGKYSGGYSGSDTASTTQNISVSTNNKDVIERLDNMHELLTTIAEKKLILSMTDVRDGLNDLKTYESNASR
jgi:TP901 family phage tail tape measure protein